MHLAAGRAVEQSNKKVRLLTFVEVPLDNLPKRRQSGGRDPELSG